VKRLAQFEPKQDEINQFGSAVFIAAEKRGGLFKPEKYLAEHPVAFPFLLDEKRVVTKSYGVYHALGTDGINIARPATFVIRRDGIIDYIYVGENQRDRAEMPELIQRLRHAASLSA